MSHCRITSANESICWYIWKYLVLTGTFPSIPIGTICSHFVPCARKFPFDLIIQTVEDKGQHTVFCNYFLRNQDTAAIAQEGWNAGMLAS